MHQGLNAYLAKIPEIAGAEFWSKKFISKYLGQENKFEK